jgi:hypothetical protein
LRILLVMERNTVRRDGELVAAATKQCRHDDGLSHHTILLLLSLQVKCCCMLLLFLVVGFPTARVRCDRRQAISADDQTQDRAYGRKQTVSPTKGNVLSLVADLADAIGTGELLSFS